MRFQATILSAVLLLAAPLSSANAAPVDIRGSTTVNSVLVAPHQADIEREAGVTLAIRPSNSGAGLADLIGFSTDIAMISAPFADVADRLSKTPPTKGLVLAEADFNIVKLGEAQVLFIVDAANPIKSLSKTQLVGLFTGEVKNWSEVGGGNVPVVLVTEPSTGAMRTEIVNKVLGGKEVSASAKTVEAAPQIAAVVAATPGGLGFISSAMPAAQRGNIKVLPTDVSLKQTLIIVTQTKPSSDAAKVVDALKKLANATLGH